MLQFVGMNFEKPQAAPQEEQGPSMPTIPAALETEEEFIKLGKEITNMSPEDKEHFIAGLDAAQKYLELEKPSPEDWVIFAGSLIGPGFVTAAGSALLSATLSAILGFPVVPAAAASAVSGGISITSEVYRKELARENVRRKAIERLRQLKAFAE